MNANITVRERGRSEYDWRAKGQVFRHRDYPCFGTSGLVERKDPLFIRVIGSLLKLMLGLMAIAPWLILLFGDKLR